MNKRQWVILVISELLLLLMVMLRSSKETITLFIFMNFDFLTIRTAYLIKNDWFKGAKWLRRTVYFIPYILVFAFFIPPGQAGGTRGWYVFFGAIFIGICFLLPRYKELRNLYNRQFIALFPPQRLGVAVIESYSLIGSAVFQELFFKLLMIEVLAPVTGNVLAVFIAAFLFTAEHIVHFQAAQLFEIRDFVMQFLMSLVGGFLYLYSGLIIVPILMHLTYNLAIAGSYFFRYFTAQGRQETV